MKKILVIVFEILILLVLCCCNRTQNVSNSVEKLGVITEEKDQEDASKEQTLKEETPEKTPEEKAEDEATVFFDGFVQKIKKGERALGGREIEDLAKAYPQNALINNYYNFFTAYFYLDWYTNIAQSQDYYTQFEHYLSLVDISLDGKYHDFIYDFTKENMGIDRYNELRGVSIEQDKIYRNLSDSDKVEILISVINREETYGENISEEQYDRLLEDVASEYGITSNDILLIMLDGKLLQQAYSTMYQPKEEKRTVEDYDAILVNDGNKVVVAANKEILDDFLNALANGNDTRIGELLLNANIAYAANGTKVNIIDNGIAVKKVRILEGTLAGVEAYTISECVEMK